MRSVDFFGGSVVKNLPAKAGNTGLTPDLGRSHIPRGQLSPSHNYWTDALEPRNLNYWKPLEPVLCDKRRHINEKLVNHN